MADEPGQGGPPDPCPLATPPQALRMTGKRTARAVQRIPCRGQLLRLFVISKRRQITPIWAGFDKPAVILHDRRGGQRLIRPSASWWPHGGGGGGPGPPCRPVSGASCSRGHLPRSDPPIHHSRQLSGAGRTGSVCSGSRLAESFRRRHVERKRGRFPARQEGGSRLLREAGGKGGAFVREEVRPEPGALSTGAREVQP